MAKQITQDQVVQTDLWENTIKSTKSLLGLIDNLNDELKKTSQISKDALKADSSDNFNGLKKTDEQVKKINKSYEDKIKLDKERIRLEDKLRQGRKLQSQQNEVIKQNINFEAKKRRELAKNTLNLVSAYQQESKTLNDLRNKYKNLAVAEKSNTKEAKLLLVQIQKLDTKLKGIDKTVGQSQRNVGNYTSAFSKLGNALRTGLGFLGITAGVTALTRVLGSSIKIAKQFEQGNANLASVLGKTRKEIGALTEDAKRLGAATSFSASEVSQLQTEFAKLGFNENEILNATEATLNLAAATGSDLGESAAIAGATLGGFGLEADETQRIVDVMAKSFSTSALDIEKFRESMKDAAPAAKAVGIDVEKTTALLGTLANSGISGSKAGNALKRSFIELNDAGLTLEEGLNQVKNSNDKLATATELVGKQAATSFLILADGVDVTNELEKGLDGAGGAAEKMAKEQLNTLEGKTKILNSAWEGFVLSLLAGEGAFSKISKSIVELATNFLGLITPSQELESSWYGQRDAVKSLEKNLNPLLDRYDDLESQTELTKDEQKELDDIIVKVAEDLPSAISGFDKYGKALSISTSAARELVQQQKDLLALDNAKAINEQEELIIDLERSLDKLNKTYVFQDGALKRISTSRKTGVTELNNATNQEIISFQKTGEGIRKEIQTRENKILKLKGEKTEIEKLIEQQKINNKETSNIVSSETKRNKTKIEGIKKEKTLLKELKSQLDAINKTREQIINIPESESAFKALSKDAKNLEIVIKNIEDRLNGIDAPVKKLQIPDYLKEEKEVKEEVNKFEIQDREKTLSVLSALNSKYFDDQKLKADEEINRTKSRESELQNLAAQGNRDAAASLAQNQKDEAESIAKREKLLQREKQIELALSIVESYRTELSDPDNTTAQALTKAITSTSVLTGFIASLPSFYDGTIDTGSNGDLDSNGGHLAMLHDNERVVDKKNNSKFGGVSNDMAANIVHDFNNDLLSYNTPQLTIKEDRFDSSKEILNKFDTLEKSIVSAINNKETYLGSDVDTMKKLILQSYSKGNTKTIVQSKYRVIK